MIEPTTLARPYARAAFEHARGANQLSEWQAALKELATILADDKVAATLRDPNQTAAQHASTLAILVGTGAAASRFATTIQHRYTQPAANAAATCRTKTLLWLHGCTGFGYAIAKTAGRHT